MEDPQYETSSRRGTQSRRAMKTEAQQEQPGSARTQACR